MDQTHLISVIVPVYRVEAFLCRCVDSVLNQTYRNLEIILVDDGSPDNCGRICDEYAQKDSRVQVIHKENGGLSSARNAGIDVARGEYLSFVDSDDWIVPDMYESMLHAMVENEVMLVCAGRYDVDGGTGGQTLGLCPEKTEKITGEELVRRVFTWKNVDSAAWDKLYHRNLFREVRYPNGYVIEDVPTTYRIALDAGSVMMLSKPVYYYYHRPGSITTSGVSEKTFHFSRHTRIVYDDIADHYPALEPYARYLRIRSLVYNMLVLDTAAPEDRSRYFQRYEDSRQELRHHFRFILTAPFFGKQERLTDILLAMGLYPGMRRIYHFIKDRRSA